MATAWLDIYDVNHGQTCHHSGLWLNNGAGRLGKSLCIRSRVRPAHDRQHHHPGSANEMQAESPTSTGDGQESTCTCSAGAARGALCINQGRPCTPIGPAPASSVTRRWAAKNFADVNGDGRIDVEIVNHHAVPYDPSYSRLPHDCPLSWRLNNGNPDPNTWPSDSNYFHFVGVAAPGALIDFNSDGLPGHDSPGVEAPPPTSAAGTEPVGEACRFRSANPTVAIVR